MNSASSGYSHHMLNAARASFVLTAAALPFSTAATNIFALLGFVLWALSGQWRPALQGVRKEPVSWLGLSLIGLLLIGTTWSIAPPSEAFDAVLKYRELLLFCIVAYLFSEARWQERLLGFFFAAALVLLLLSSAIQLGLFTYSDQRGFSSMQNAVLLKNHITHGFIMSVLSYGSAVLAIRSAGWLRWALWAVAALAAFNVLFGVQGRTGYVTLTLLLIWIAYTRWSVRGLVGITAGLALILGAAYQWAPAFKDRLAEAAVQVDAYRGDAKAGETAGGLRLFFWMRSAEWMKKRPLLGAGTGGWSAAFYEATESDGPTLHDRDHAHPHNEFVNLTVQLGPLGLILFVALLAAAFVRAARLPGAYAPLMQGFVLAFAAGCVFNDFLWDTTEGHMWALLGGALFGAARNAGEA